MYTVLHVKYPLFVSDFNELEFSGQILEKYSNMKFRKNRSSGSQVVPCRRIDRQTYMHMHMCSHTHSCTRM